MTIVYVAGKYRGNGWNEVYENISLARSHARQLWLKGYAVICPHANSYFMDGPDIPDRTFLDGDIEILSRCDAIYMLPNWADSEGAKEEYYYALNHGIKILGPDIPTEPKILSLDSSTRASICNRDDAGPNPVPGQSSDNLPTKNDNHTIQPPRIEGCASLKRLPGVDESINPSEPALRGACNMAGIGQHSDLDAVVPILTEILPKISDKKEG